MADKQSSGGKRKRNVLSLSQRLKIIQAVQDNVHKSRSQIAQDLGIPLSTLSNLMKHKSKYLGQAKSGNIVTTSKRARGKENSQTKRIAKEVFLSAILFRLFSLL